MEEIQFNNFNVDNFSNLEFIIHNNNFTDGIYPIHNVSSLEPPSINPTDLNLPIQEFSIENDNQLDEQHQDHPDRRPEPQKLICSLYITRVSYPEPNHQEHISQLISSPFPSTVQLQRQSSHQNYYEKLSELRLKDAILESQPEANWKVIETSCGLIASFSNESDADNLLQQIDLSKIFEGSVQIARFSARDTRYRQSVLLRDIPWAIPLQELTFALSKQGISTGNIERSRNSVRVEVLEHQQYERLLHQGLDFFGAARFSAVPDRWWRNTSGLPALPGPFSSFYEFPLRERQPQSGDGVLQCYRCQGFWHVAAQCRHLPRCVRCGEAHTVEFCSRPRNNPICCHCSGPHHAGYRQCPVRLQLLNAKPVSVSLSTCRVGGGVAKPNLYSCNNNNNSDDSNGNNVN